MKLRSLLLVPCFLGVAIFSFAQETLKIASSPTPGIYLFTMQMNMQGQEMELNIEHEIKEDGDNIVINDKTATPFGTNESVSIVKKNTLEAVSAESTGFAGMKLTYGETKITGETSTMQGAKSPIDITKTGAVYDANVIVSHLPLKEGYSTSFQTFNAFARKLTKMELKVIGKESVEVAGGTFDAYKVEMTSADLNGMVIHNWVTINAPTMVVKSETTLPQGGKMVLQYTGMKADKKDKKAKK